MLTSGNEWGLMTAGSLGSGSGGMSQWKQAVTAGRASDPDLQWLWKGREGRLDVSLVPVFAYLSVSPCALKKTVPHM